MLRNFVSLCLLVPFFASCHSNGSEKGRVEKTLPKTEVAKTARRAQLLFPSQDSLLVMGQALPVGLSFSDLAPQSLSVSLNGASKVPLEVGEGPLLLPTAEGLIGDNSYVMYIDYPDSAHEALSIRFQLHSDIKPKIQSYQVQNVYPHNEGSFTQGLFFHQGRMYEGSGVQGRSAIRSYGLETGEVFQEAYIPPEYFGEGIALMGDIIYQLTYKAKKILLYTQDTFNKVGERPWNSEGWGLTTDGNSLILSDGSFYLYFLDPVSMVEKRRVKVSDGERFIKKLNELEYIEGRVYANVWETDSIVGIDPSTGKVETYLDMKGILPGYSADKQRSKVLNGIAYHPERKNFIITGKEWPQLFEIRVKP